VLGFTRDMTYEGQAAIWLEGLARDGADAPPYDLPGLSPGSLIGAMIRDRQAGQSDPDIARRFHRTMARRIARVASDLARGEGIELIVFSGGVVQNALLLDLLVEELRGVAEVLTNIIVPSNDGGLSLGQAALAHAPAEPA
jgi:hydrogenase maturation protein HypF